MAIQPKYYHSVKMGCGGFSLVSTMVAGFILTATGLLVGKAVAQLAGQHLRIRSAEAPFEIELDLRAKMMKLASTFLLNSAAVPGASCQLTSVPKFAITDSALLSGFTAHLLDRSGVSANYDLTDFLQEFPVSGNDSEYAAAISRCKNNSTLYANDHAGGVQSDISEEKGLYFCAYLAPNGEDRNQHAASLQRLRPIVVEMLFIPYDVKYARPLSCNELTSGWPSTAVGQIYYTIYWKTPNHNNSKITQSLKGFYQSAHPYGL